MTIKVGTLCLIMSVNNRRCNGMTCTVTGPQVSVGDTGLPLGGPMYPTDVPSVYGPSKFVFARRDSLIPLNDPDNAPADPAYTKRRTTV